MSLVFPWSAVVGQERLKLALLLCAIDPGIGGVLVRGPRGVAKTTLARGFAELLPGRFVELPLGATEERVTGTLDLGKVLQHGQVEFSPGLLARAHEGVLYVDEVNLLPDALVDLLLDASATGTNVVERDGVSQTHAARFVLVGTMNPEEGELRPQFIDRFGLSVAAASELSPRERSQIVLRRLEFERSRERFVAAFAEEQRALRERCARARERASSLGFAGPGLERVAEICHAARVEGVRADLAMLRAARAHAVWHGRDQVEVDDVEVVKELALAHRRRGAPETPPASPRGGSDTGSQREPGRSSGAGQASQRPAASQSSGSSATHAAGEQGSLPPVPVRATSVLLPPEWTGADARQRVPLQPRPVRLRRSQLRRSRGVRGPIDWFGTLLRAPRPTPADVRHRRRSSAPARLWIVAIDCSSSMLHSGALALAKGVAGALATRAAKARERVALVSFSGDLARTQLGSSAAGLDSAIAALGGGGGTPLRRALLEAIAVGCRPASAGSALEKRLLILTDGRTREDVTDLCLRCRELLPYVVDCERGALRLGRARQLAAALQAGYVHVETFA